jgi:hypothetical protein
LAAPILAEYGSTDFGEFGSREVAEVRKPRAGSLCYRGGCALRYLKTNTFCNKAQQERSGPAAGLAQDLLSLVNENESEFHGIVLD